MSGKQVVSMEKSHSRNDATRDEGETSSGATEAAQTTHNISIQATSLEERFKMVWEAGENAKNQSSTPKIQKVIFLLRDHENFEKYFEPRVVSLGPIHHGKEKYQLGEKYKLQLTYEFVNSSGIDINILYKKIEENIKELRDCFEEEVTKPYENDKALAWLLFVDGCAILQYIYCATNSKFKELNIKTDSVTFGHQDLFLLENQLPYRLLKWLMSLSKMEKELRHAIKLYIERNDMIPEDQKSRCCGLNWLSLTLWPRSKGQLAEGDNERTTMNREPIHLLDLLRTSLLVNHDPQVHKIKRKKRKYQDWQSYHNVQELKVAGIHLKRSNNSCLSNISFSRRYLCFGYLLLPPITVDDSTRPKFLNLIAY